MWKEDNKSRLTSKNDPSSQYAGRAEVAAAAAKQCERKHIQIGNLRLVVALITAGLIYGCFRSFFSWPILLVPLVLFIILMVWHSKVLAAMERAMRIQRYYARGLARMNDEWQGHGETGDRFLDNQHPYARDLDLFGPASLFQLMNLARTRMGEDCLANWLSHASTPDSIRARQQAVAELATKLDLREDLAVLGEEARSGVHPSRLRQWAKDPVVLRGGFQQFLAFPLAIINVAGLAVWYSTGHVWLLLAGLALTSVYGFTLRGQISPILMSAAGAAGDLQLLAAVLARIEKEKFSAPYLVHLRQTLETDGEPPSVAVARLARLAQWIDSLRNPAMQLLNLIFLVAIHLAFSVESWRKAHAPMIGKWLDAVGEIEAALSLAAYSYEHPLDLFPEVLDPAHGVVWEAQGLGHPLLKSSATIRNDLSLSSAQPFVIISGSNMSGKSTLLRTAGVNTVLALAGAPVRATTFRLTPLNVGASIQTIDSLAEGRSRFYTEILRLKQIVEMTKDGHPVFFLLDELLAGTNSHDRRIGAAGILCGLLDSGSVGMVTTHDLSLTQLEDARVRNMHFEDHLENGVLRFDYRMRPGVVSKSNALELMRAVGLDV